MARTMDSPNLRKLARPQLQALAKREFVRAVGKTEDIIRRLLKKHPKGVPVPDTASPSAPPSASVSDPSKRKVTKTPRKSAEVIDLASTSTQPKAYNLRNSPKTASKSNAPTLSTHSDDVQLLYPEDEPVAGPSNANPVPVPKNPRNGKAPTAAAAIALAIAVPDVTGPAPAPAPAKVPAGPSAQPPIVAKKVKAGRVAPANIPSKPPHVQPPAQALAGPSQHPSTPNNPNPNPAAEPSADDDWDDPNRPLTFEEEELQDEEDNRSVHSDDPRVSAGPDENMVVDVLRQFTLLVDATPTIRTRLSETKTLLKRTEKQVEKLLPDAKELTETREYLEEVLLARMKDKKDLVDGTNTLKDKDARRFRLEWLRDERRKENAKRWRDVNRVNAARGWSPQPFEDFEDPESDTPTSLRSSPANSRNGSPKRTREESDADDSDFESDEDPRRKRSRS